MSASRYRLKGMTLVEELKGVKRMPESNQNMNNCNFTKFEKNKYFYGKLMTVRDFETEQQYFDGKRSLINRLLHGTGIICGFQNVKLIKKENEPLKINFEDGGMALDCCGHEIVVPSSTLDKETVNEAGSPVSSNSVPNEFYLYLKYKTCYGSYLAVASNSSSCEEKCCPGRVVEDFSVVISDNSPHSACISCRKDFPSEPELIDEAVKKWLDKLERDNWFCPLCAQNEGTKVFLASIKSNNDGTLFVDEEDTEKYRPAIFRNEELYQIFKCHSLDFKNPHGVTATQVQALVSIEGVNNPGGNIDLIPENSICINADNTNKRITIGENHSARTDNPHSVTAAQTGALVSVEGVSNPGGNINLIPINSISISADDTKNSITLGETHSARTDNPHEVTAEQVKALTSINGITNPGGNIELVVNKGSIEIAPDDTLKRILIEETHSSRTDNPHEVNAAQTGALVSLNGVSNPGGNIDLVPGMNIKITPDENNNFITLDCTLGLEVQPAEAEPKSVGIKNVVGTSTRYAREDHEHKLEENFVDYTRLSVDLQNQLNVLNMYLRERALKCSVSSFKKVEEEFKNDKFLGVSLLFKKAVREKKYEKESDFLDFIKNTLDQVNAFKEEIKAQAEAGSFNDFDNALQDLQSALSGNIPLKVAAQQDEVCFYALELKRNINEPMFRALSCTVINFRNVAKTFKSEIANNISLKFEEGISSKVYENEEAFVKFMTANHQLLKVLPAQIGEDATEDSLNNYITAVDDLIEVINESNDALSIAAMQEEVCSAAKRLEPISQNPMYRALKCTVTSFRQINLRFDSDVADKISEDFEAAIKNKVYENEDAFIQFMKDNLTFLNDLFPNEIKHIAIEKDFTNYIAVVNELTEIIKSNKAREIAAKQEELCFFARDLRRATAVYKALKCTAVNFVEVADIFENETAKKISQIFDKAVTEEVYEDENDFIDFMKEHFELFRIFAKEIRELATKETLHDYITALERMEGVIGSGNAHNIAERQEEVCSYAKRLEVHLIA
jgi:hypothetical protein